MAIPDDKQSQHTIMRAASTWLQNEARKRQSGALLYMQRRAQRNGEVDNRHFDDTVVDLLELHEMGFPPRDVLTGSGGCNASGGILANPGDYHYRSNHGSTPHLNDPAALAKLQEATAQATPEEGAAAYKSGLI